MTYRKYQESDKDQVELLCLKHKISLPNPNTFLIVAENNGRIEGIGGLTNLTFIEPLISENPIAAVGLFNRIEGILIEKGIKMVHCYCEKDKEEVFNKAGFSIFEKDHLLMRKGN